MAQPDTTTRAAQVRLGVCRQTIRNWLRSGRLAGRKVGDRWLVEESAIAALERPEEPRP